MAHSIECQLCGNKKADGIIPLGEEKILPLYACWDCAIRQCSTVFYDGFPIFHFRSENGQWFFVFVHHDSLVPYFYPSPNPQITTDAGGEILFKRTAGGEEYREISKSVCKRIVPYKLITPKRRRTKS